jgi:zinc/manganese transport system substrate-binding protein
MILIIAILGRMRKINKLVSTFSALVIFASCSSSSDSTNTSESISQTNFTELPVIAVTYSVLGDLVSQLVGDNATVNIVIPDGQDPHDFQPSAKDIEALNNAAIIVSNGLDFEEGLNKVLKKIADSGGNIFMVGENITVLKNEEGTDPHLWLSPATMLEMLPALTTAINQATGSDISDSANLLTAKLQDLDKEVAALITSLGECKLVSGHDEMRYFADRYGCEVIGAIIPSFTTTSEATAGELAKLKIQIEQNKVSAIFTGLGASPDTATQLARELGVKAVTLSTHYLDGVANYQEFILKMVKQIEEALG